jgi:hypothetical protein
MSVMTLEGVVEQGQIRLSSNIRLKDHTRVLVVVPDYGTDETHRIVSPRLVRADQLVDFEMEIIEGTVDANV